MEGASDVHTASDKLTRLMESGEELQRRNSNTVVPSSVTRARQVGTSSIQGHRESQEDAHHAAPLGPEWDLYCVFDGHGGELASKFCADELPGILLGLLEQKIDAKDAVQRSLRMLEKRFLARAKDGDLLDGTTACVVLLGASSLVHGNIGDSEAVLSHVGGVVGLSEVHNAARNPREAERVLASGGQLVSQRLCHPVLAPRFCSIAVTRSIGDVLFKDEEFCRGKPITLLGEPFITSRPLEPTDEFIILACDGVWDALSHERACDIVRDALAAGTSAQKASEAVCSVALEEGSTDNITCIVVELQR